jgi:hypothetical protein
MSDRETFDRINQNSFVLATFDDEQLDNYLGKPVSHFDANPLIFGLILAEKLVRHWLRSNWDFFDFNRDLKNTSFEPIVASLLSIFQSSKKFRKGLSYVSDAHLPSRDEELPTGHPNNYFQNRLLDFITCDGIVLVVRKDLEELPAISIPFKLILHSTSSQLIDKSTKAVRSEEWESALSEFSELSKESFAMQLCASFDKRSTELVGSSFLLSLKAALWKKEGKLNLHPLEFGISGGINFVTGEIELVESLKSKGKCAQSNGAFLFVAPSPCPSPELDSLTWIDVQNRTLEDTLGLIEASASQMWFKRALDLKFYAGEKHSSITFKLTYDLDLPMDWEIDFLNGFRLVKEGEGTHLSRFRINHLTDVFSENLFFRKDHVGKDIPLIFELDLTSLKSFDTLRIDSNDPTTKWAKLIGVDLIPYKGKSGVPSVRLGFIFETLKGKPVTFENYQKFITKRRFGKVALFRSRGKEFIRSVSISQIIIEIQKMLFQQKDFNLGESFLAKSSEEKGQPQIIQYLLSPEYEGEYGDEFWKELTGRFDFQKGFQLISSLCDLNRSKPKTKVHCFEIGEAVFTQYALHHRAVTAWSHSSDQFNRETKALIITKPFSFISLLAHIAIEMRLDHKTCESIFEKQIQTRRDFFRQCIMQESPAV